MAANKGKPPREVPHARAMPDNRGKTYKRNVYDPRVDMFKQFYLRPDSYTFFNILQSALRAGYSQQYSENISVQQPKWWLELIESGDYTRAKMLHAAENRLHEVVDAPLDDDPAQKRIQTDVAKYVTERLGKAFYSARQEVTGADGRRLFTNDNRAGAVAPLKTLFKGVQAPQ